jgi:hypothetical protein
MRIRTVLGAAVLALLVPAGARAGGLSRTFLVPSYAACPGPAVCVPRRESSFTFDKAILHSSQARYIAPNKLSLVVELSGVKDASGALVTTDPSNPADDFRLVVPSTQVTLSGVGTLPTGFPGTGDTVVRIDLKQGAGKGRLTTPEETPKSGLVTGSLGVPALYDNQGNRLAVTGAQTPP